MKSRDGVSRRTFMAKSSTGIGGGIAGLHAASVSAAPSANEKLKRRRQVWVASMGQMDLKADSPKEMCKKMLARMEEALPMRPDIFCTPEVFPCVGLPSGKRPPLEECAEEKSGAILDMFAEFARAHHCYVICSTYTKEKGHCYNAAVLLDRQGEYVGEYRKINPTRGELESGVTPGPLDPPVFETDFGVIGMQICYDVNWYENWTKLSHKGAEMVFWPSAFGGGKMLNSLAWMNKYYVVTSTRNEHPTKIVDPLGEDLVATGRAGNWICAPVNMDCAVIQTVAMFKHFRDIREKYGRQFNFRILHTEALALVEGLSGEVSVAEVLKEYGIPTSVQMLWKDGKSQDALRPA